MAQTAARYRGLSLLAFCALSLSGCNAATQSPTPEPLVDSFFSGYAFVDTNGNGQVDAEDAPLKDARFIIKLKPGEVGALTDVSGYAFVIVPGGVEYPVVLTMKPPEDSTYLLVGPASITWTSGGGEKAEFLFTLK